MNVEANAAASEKWEKLFKYIRVCSYESVDLSDSQADRYDFANEILMRRMRDRLVETLQRNRYSIGYLTFGNKFFMTVNEQQQQSFFGSIFNLPVWRITVGEDETDEWAESPAITISTPALLETLPHLHRWVRDLIVNNFALTCQSDVQVLSNIIGSKCETLQYLSLDSIECPVDECDEEDSDEPDGFLDPLFYAASDLRAFSVSTKTRSVHSTLVSPTALRALLVERKNKHELSLRGLGLTDSHVLAIVDGLSTPGAYLFRLNLESNPGITAQGYGALFDLINRANIVGSFDYLYDVWRGFCVDEKAWEGKLNLASEMNSEYGRLEYLTNGTFTSAERRWQWLERAVGLPSSNLVDEDKRKKHLNFIWYTLRQNPEMMQVSQAPTWTRKRKATRSTSPLSGAHSAKSQRR
jgi:hypothetical protein